MVLQEDCGRSRKRYPSNLLIMNIDLYLKPIDTDSLGYKPSEFAAILGSKVKLYQPGTGMEIPEKSLLLVGVGDDRGAENNAGCSNSPDEIRYYLYQLTTPSKDTEIIDLGNVIEGQTPEDTYYALSEVVAEAIEKDCVLIILGGTQDLTFGAYKGYERMNRIMNITAIDPRFDIEDSDYISSRSWLKNIIMQVPNYLFFSSNIGYQTYFVGEDYIRLMDDLRFDAYRLADVQHEMVRAETLIRNADMVSVDISAVRQSDAPGNGFPSPHGFYGEEFCHMMRFAGMSEKTNCLGIFEVNSVLDRQGQTAHMVAQGVWFFIEGYYNRKMDNPLMDPDSCRRFMVPLEKHNMDIYFYKSKISDRWWVSVPCHNPEMQELYSNQMLLPCTYADYQQASTKGEVPLLWLKYYQRLNG